MKTYLRLLRYLKPYVWKLVLAMGFMAVLAATTAVYAYMVGPLLKFIFAGGAGDEGTISRVMAYFMPASANRETLLTYLPFFLVAVAVVKGLSYAGQFYFMGDVGQRVIFDLRRELHDKLLGQSLDFYHDRRTGDILARFLSDVGNVENAVTYAVSTALRDTSQVVVLLVMLFYLDWKLSLMAFVVLPVAAGPLTHFSRGLKAVTMKAQAKLGDISGMLSETIQGAQVVQAFGMEGYERVRFDAENRNYLKIMHRSFFIRAIQSPVMEILGVAGLALTVWYAARRIQAGELPPEHFISFFATVVIMYMPIKNIGKMNQFFQSGIAGASRVFEYIDAVPTIRDGAGATPLDGFPGPLRFEGVRFKYRDVEVLKGVDIEIPQGKTIALVGESGAGKTTLASLLPRFYDVSGGRVAVGGRDVREVTVASLRSKMALVTQDVFLFNDTVQNNISYGNPTVPKERVEAAAKAAYAHDFVMAMPKGYDTLIGERGIKLSGGQKQRVAIARALLKDAPVLILDEATSSLDSEGEAEVQKALDELMKNRTTFVIAHRLSTVRNADEIVVLKDGRVIERGRHDELLERRGEYAKLYELQFRDG